MSLYDQRLLADANTDNYSTIVAFEEQEQHQQARTLQDSGYLSDHNASDANVMVGGGGGVQFSPSVLWFSPFFRLEIKETPLYAS